MKRHILFLSLFVILLTLSGNSYSQITLQFGAGGSYNLPAGDYGNNVTDFYNGKAYGMASGYNGHLKARIGLLGFVIFGEIDYQSFAGDGSIPAGSGGGTIKNKNSVISFKLGPEFHLPIPALPIDPYLSAHLSVNNFSGEVEFKGVAGVPSGTYDIEAASRLGIGFGGGVVFNLGTLKLDLGLQYNMINLLGKSWKDADPAVERRLDSYTNLNDDKDPLLNLGGVHFVSDTRAINAIQISATFMFGI